MMPSLSMWMTSPCKALDQVCLDTAHLWPVSDTGLLFLCMLASLLLSALSAAESSKQSCCIRGQLPGTEPGAAQRFKAMLHRFTIVSLLQAGMQGWRVPCS